MRRRVRKKILESLHTMKEAQEIAVNMLLNGQAADAGGLLLQCQEGAQKIGESIEQSEGEGTGAVSCLEEYCEILYQMSRSTEERQVAVYRDQLDRILQQAEYEVKEHLPVDCLKVVFLPYKASMWDCMESVWEAADADPECEALVVPIPYYEKNGQGSIVRECYEGDLFPKDVPVVPYRAYHLEEEQPDIVYIHNPYDGGNTITTVHPDYYSSNLKKYTDLLVYIPYYICGNGPLPDCHLSLPAYEYVDKIIVQDEEKVKNLLDFVPEEKIVVLGTPKVDRIRKLNQKKDEILENGIPQEWREKIRGKKVILYNISVTGILRNSKYAMDKIRYVLSCFEGREDVVLWWRPHPLLEATLQSTLPALYGEYMEIKREFAGSRNGILDETGDAAVAAVIADAYLGENSSSMACYFDVLGKPIYFTNWMILEEMTEEERAGIFFTDCYFEDKYGWFVPRSELAYQYLCKMDLESGEISLEYELPGEFENPKKGNAYFGIAKVRENVILAPVWSNDIYVYRLRIGQAIKIPLRRADQVPNFCQVVEYQNGVYLTPRNYPAVVELDIEMGLMTEYGIPVLDEERDEKEFLFGIGSTVCDDCIYIPCADRKAILVFNMRNKEYSVKIIEEAEAGFYSLTSSKDEIWGIGNKTSEVFCWNIATDEVRIFKDLPAGYVGGVQPFRQIVEIKKGMLIYPENANMTLFICRDSQKLQECDALKDFIGQEELLQNPDSVLRHWLVKKWKSEVLSLRAHNKGFVHYESERSRSIVMTCRLQQEDRRRLENKEFERLLQESGQPGTYYETLRWSISIFLDYMSGQDGNGDERMKEMRRKNMGIEDGNCGQKIHQWIRDKLWKE